MLPPSTAPNRRIRLISLFGRAGAGKTTIGDALAAEFGFHHLPLGRMLREPDILWEIGINPDEMARAVATGRTIDADVLYPWLDIQIAASLIPVVVDGYPRIPAALPHFNALAQRLCTEGAVLALHLTCAPAIAAERVQTRGRDDDKTVDLTRRNQEFDRIQRPLLDRLDPNVSVIEIDASCHKDEVLSRVRKMLGLRKA